MDEQDNYARSARVVLDGPGEPSTMRQRYPMAPEGCIPTPRSNQARRVEINQVNYGYVVSVGCQTLVFENMDTLIDKLTAYLKDPNAVEKKWMTEGIL